MKGGTKRSNEKGRAKTQIRDSQAWGSCAKFTAVIWNPTALASGWRGRHNRFSFARNSPCLVGVSVTACLSLLLFFSLSLSLCLWSASPSCMVHKWNLHQDRQHISTIPEQPALKTQRREGSFQLWRAKRKMWIDRLSRQREAPSKLLWHFEFSSK